MGLSWQQGPLAPGALGRFLVPEPLPKRLLYAERLRRRMRVRFGGTWIADSENVLLLFEPGHYPMAYFPETDVSPNILQPTEHRTRHPDLGLTSWYTVRAAERTAPRGAWQHIDLPAHASDLQGRVAFAWPAMDAFYEEDERILAMPPIAITASTSARAPAISWSAIATALSPTPSAPLSSMSPASRRAGTFNVPTSITPH